MYHQALRPWHLGLKHFDAEAVTKKRPRVQARAEGTREAAQELRRWGREAKIDSRQRHKGWKVLCIHVLAEMLLVGRFHLG